MGIICIDEHENAQFSMDVCWFRHSPSIYRLLYSNTPRTAFRFRVTSSYICTYGSILNRTNKNNVCNGLQPYFMFRATLSNSSDLFSTESWNGLTQTHFLEQSIVSTISLILVYYVVCCTLLQRRILDINSVIDVRIINQNISTFRRIQI